MNDMVRVANPFGEMPQQQLQGGAMVVAEQQRAVAEVVAAMQIARANPRNPIVAMNLIINDCSLPTLAEDATYEYARGGSSITGPSIRLAETIARRWGNIKTGVVELARREGYSEVKAFAMDLETGFVDEKIFQVKHWRDTKTGGHAIKEERDIYEHLANVAARRKRACILSCIPTDVVDAALQQCEITLKTKLEVNPELIGKLLESFGEVGVTREHIEKLIQRKIDAITPALVLRLRRIRASIRDGMSGPADWFDMGQPAPAATEAAKSGLAGDLAKQAAEAKKKAEAEAKAKAEADAKAKAETEHKAKEESERNAKKKPAEKNGAAKQGELVDQQTGEIHSTESIGKRIEQADKAGMDAILQDILKMPASVERAGLMTKWNERTMALAQGGKPGGTEEELAKAIKEMGECKDQAALDLRADLCAQFAWSAGQREKLNEAYYKRTDELKA